MEESRVVRVEESKVVRVAGSMVVRVGESRCSELKTEAVWSVNPHAKIIIIAELLLDVGVVRVAGSIVNELGDR